MNKDTSITIRLKNELKEQFEKAVKAQFVKAVQNNEDYEHINAPLLRKPKAQLNAPTWCPELIQFIGKKDSTPVRYYEPDSQKPEDAGNVFTPIFLGRHA